MERTQIGVQQVLVALRQMGAQRRFDGGQLEQLGQRQQRPNHRYIDQPSIPVLERQIMRGHGIGGDVGAGKGPAQHRAVGQQQAARLHQRFVFVGRWAVEGDGCLRVAHKRGANRLVADDHRAVCRAAAHFWPVRRNPGHFLTGLEGSIGQQLARKESALAAKSGNNQRGFHITPPCHPSFRPADVLKSPSG